MREEENWIDGAPSVGIEFQKTGDEEYWIDGQPVVFISDAGANDDFMPFFWGV